MNTKKIIIIGGHITPAIAVIEKLKDKTREIVFIGRKYPTDKTKNVSLEYDLITKNNIKFYNLNTPKIHRDKIFRSILSVPLFLIAVWQSLRIMRKEKPDCIVSFGGYLAVPVCIAGKLQNIPILTHEQTMTLGLANRIIATIANTVCMSWSIEKKGGSKNIVMTGNPVRNEFFSEKKKPDFWPSENLPVLYVTGGNIGSHAINLLILNDLEYLLSRYCIIHQTGNISEFHDFEKLEKKKETLPEKIRGRYSIKMHMNVAEVAYTFRHADLLIGRAGANTIAEILVSEIPSILIPLPWSAGHEQEKQADYIQKKGLGVKLMQAGLTSQLLNEEIEKVLKASPSIKKSFKVLEERGALRNAAENVVREIEKLLVQ